MLERASSLPRTGVRGGDERLAAPRFRVANGKELWTAKLDATGNATPLTYLGRDGQQYIAIAAGGPAHLRSVGDTSSNTAEL